MTRPRPKSVSLTKVSKAIRLPRHPLSNRLRKLLEMVDAVHTAANLKQVTIVMDRRVTGGLFFTHADTGPYSIYLNPYGSHPELSLLHELGHFLEWQCIPKDQHGPRDFATDLHFTVWLQAVYETQTTQRLLSLLEQQEEDTQSYKDLDYLLRAGELWTRAYSQYLAGKTSLSIISQEISAENKVVTGNITYKPYWGREEFIPVQEVMDMMFTELGWIK